MFELLEVMHNQVKMRTRDLKEDLKLVFSITVSCLNGFSCRFSVQ